MYRNILPKINFLIFLAIATAAVILQSTIFAYTPLNYFQPDFFLIIAVYFGFRRGLLEGGIFMILASAMMELHSGTGNHFFLTTYLYAFLIAKLISQTIVVPTMLSSIGIVVALSIAKDIALLILIEISGGHASNGLRHFFIFLIPGVAVQALFTPPLFGWFGQIDLKTFKDEHSEDEYDINKGF